MDNKKSDVSTDNISDNIGERSSIFKKSLEKYYPSVLVNKFLDRVNSGRLRGWTNSIAMLLIICAVISGSATYLALNSLPPFGDNPSTVFWLLNVDLIILLLLVTLISRRLAVLFSGRKKGIAGSRIHARLVFIFSFLAATPAIIMTIFSAIFLYYGIHGWFNERVSTAINESQAVAQAYLAEHQQVIKVDTLAMANDLNRQSSLLLGNQIAFNRTMQTQSVLRNLSEAVVFDSRGQILAKSGLTFTLAFEYIPEYALKSAEEGEVVLMTGSADDRVRALVKLNNFVDAYLFVGRMVDPTVLRHVSDTRQAAQEYERLKNQSWELQLKITLIFVIVALLLLLAAIWFGLHFAKQLVLPISNMIKAADSIRAGDLSARVQVYERGDEFDVLGRTFNRMTSQLQEQRDELIMANRQLDQRRRFTETVLAGVSSGIIGVDDKGKITIVNSSAADLFHMDTNYMIGKYMSDLLPDLDSLLKQAHNRPNKITQSEIPYITVKDTKRIFLVRIAIEMMGEEDKGAVLTFDDITELQSAQRKAAWADVARRIAHEIKNPLTPIQLSAERLKRKYLKQISEDPETFSKCTDTIIHHVGDIGRMVNEFSSFARMPEAILKYDNLVNHIQDTLILQQQAHPHIKLKLVRDANVEAIYTNFDAQQIRQAFTNIIQNALDSIQARIEDENHRLGKTTCDGQINVLITKIDNNDEAIIAVSDNGIGLPKDEDPNRLVEPYVTHRDKGTGLGLAIVKKIMDDHQGSLIIGVPEWIEKVGLWENLGGATIILTIPLNSELLTSKESKLVS